MRKSEVMGEEAMWEIVEMHYQGMAKIRKILGDDTIDYDACGGYECFTENHLFEQIPNQFSWLNKGMKFITGKEDVFTMADDFIGASGMKILST